MKSALDALAQFSRRIPTRKASTMSAAPLVASRPYVPAARRAKRRRPSDDYILRTAQSAQPPIPIDPLMTRLMTLARQFEATARSLEESLAASSGTAERAQALVARLDSVEQIAVEAFSKADAAVTKADDAAFNADTAARMAERVVDRLEQATLKAEAAANRIADSLDQSVLDADAQTRRAQLEAAVRGVPQNAAGVNGASPNVPQTVPPLASGWRLRKDLLTKTPAISRSSSVSEGFDFGSGHVRACPNASLFGKQTSASVNGSHPVDADEHSVSSDNGAVFNGLDSQERTGRNHRSLGPIHRDRIASGLISDVGDEGIPKVAPFILNMPMPKDRDNEDPLDADD